MAGARALLLDLDPDRVLIAIDPHLDDALGVAGAFALLPQRLARARKIPRLAGLDRAPERLGVHVRDHQKLAAPRVGGDAGDEAIGVELRRQHEAFFDFFRDLSDTAVPRSIVIAGESVEPAHFDRD